MSLNLVKTKHQKLQELSTEVEVKGPRIKLVVKPSVKLKQSITWVSLPVN